MAEPIERRSGMLEPGTRVRLTVEGELEHLVASQTGVRAAVKIGNGVSLTVPYSDVSPARTVPASDTREENR